MDRNYARRGNESYDATYLARRGNESYNATYLAFPKSACYIIVLSMVEGNTSNDANAEGGCYKDKRGDANAQKECVEKVHNQRRRDNDGYSSTTRSSSSKS